MLRRDFARTLAALAVAPVCLEASEAAAGPPFWVASRRRARIYLFGFGQARDRSWFTPSIQNAFDSASHLWLEVDRSRPIEEMDAVFEKHGRDPHRTFLASLEPSVRERAVEYMSELDIDPGTVRTMRPWFAYFTFARAFDARHGKSAMGDSPEAVLAGLARQSSKKIGYERSMAALVESLAAMPDKAQSQYMQWLFDHFDEQKSGLADASTGWIVGDTAAATRSLKRMRALPSLYRIMQIERNGWWARKIIQLLDTQQTHFIAVGQLHVLGPDGIPRELARRDRDLTPNPTVPG